MKRNYRKVRRGLQAGAVRLVTQTGKPIAMVAQELGISEVTLGNWATTRSPSISHRQIAPRLALDEQMPAI